MIFLDEGRVAELLHLEELLPVMEKALIDFSAGRVIQPVRSVLAIPQHRAFFGLMPAVYEDVIGTKLVSVFPQNAERGLHTHLAIYLSESRRYGREPGGDGRPRHHGLAYGRGIGDCDTSARRRRRVCSRYWEAAYRRERILRR